MRLLGLLGSVLAAAIGFWVKFQYRQAVYELRQDTGYSADAGRVPFDEVFFERNSSDWDAESSESASSGIQGNPFFDDKNE